MFRKHLLLYQTRLNLKYKEDQSTNLQAETLPEVNLSQLNLKKRLDAADLLLTILIIK